MSLIALTMLLIPFSNVAAASKSTVETESNADKNSHSLEEILKEDNVTNEEMSEYSQYAKEEMANEPTPQWKLGAVKKAVKFAVNNKNLIPSKKVRGWVDKYGGKMVKALDYVDAASTNALISAFVRAGIPASAATPIAEFIVTWLL